MTTPPAVVAVTGASGYIGTSLLRQLEEKGTLDKLVAIDNRPLPFPIHNIAAYRRNVTQPIDDALAKHHVSTLVHLAFISRRGRNRREVNEIRENNLAALKAVLESCVRAGVKHVIYVSSNAVYGARPDNQVPLTVRSPLRPQPDYPYGYDKYLSEQALQEFADHQGDTKVTILRSCMVLGPTAGNHVTQAFFKPWLLEVDNQNPPLQFVYEDDLARVVDIFIQRGIPGVFNVAGDGVVFYREMAKIIGSRLVSLPAFLAYPLVRSTWNLRLQRDSTAAGLNLIRYPMVVSTGTLKQATGYKFWHTSMDALTAYANSNLLFKD
ncbi:MAG: NAD-dependent epimerase/dehydratase family protein [Chloroflexi bacterium]|nr:NAD-dependent epimerase/dehydratase family protein [Chloroflexota bacterium]